MASGANNWSASQNWQSLGGNGFYGYNNQGGSAVPSARDALDATRIGVGRVPSAEYPDGYLGTIRSRRDDRLLDSIKSRVNQKAYQRGVHKGERIDPGDYVWPTEWSNQSGISNQFKGRRTTLIALNVRPTHLVNDGKADIPNNVPPTVDARRRQQLGRLRPAWA